MITFDIEVIRTEVRAIDFTRGTPAEVAMWREDMADSRANVVIEDMIPTPNDDAFFEMMLVEAVPPSPRVANPPPAARSSRRDLSGAFLQAIVSLTRPSACARHINVTVAAYMAGRRPKDALDKPDVR